MMTLGFMSGSTYITKQVPSLAAAVDSADIRIIFTTDLHGRLTTMDYELGTEYEVGSLAKAATLIQEARDEKETGNSFTFDLGDALFDYTTESIYEMDSKAIQPIFLAMRTIGYDAMVLGNHEFDYGYDYIMNQLQGAGLMSKIVVSNLTNLKTGKSPFKENMIIEREVTTESGKTTTISVGIIGETVPVLSRKRENYTGLLETKDIVANVKEQAKKLKAEGADIIVVLSHSGFGTENPTEFSKDASYALTKIPEVDVVLAGHEHKLFPSSSSASARFYTLPGVDKETGLVNGKNMVMVNDKGQSIGVVDLTVQVNGSTAKITERHSEVRKVTASTEAHEKINTSFGKWQEIFEAAMNNQVGNVAKGNSLNNYLGLVKDTNSIQLLNNAKIHYALQYIYSSAAKYEGYPIVAASTHNRYGQLSANDFTNLTGEITEANLSAIAPFNKYIFLYEIKGSQLKEWLEWSASAYETLSDKASWSDETMQKLIEETGVSSLIAEEWLDEWSNFYVFDGVSYTIDPSVAPRYNADGTKINNTSRISSLTYNGKPITDDMKLVLATDSISNTKSSVLKSVENQAIYKGINKSITILMDYIEQLSDFGDIVQTVDNNWSIQLPERYNFLLKVSKAANLKELSDLDYTLVESMSEYNYYQVEYKERENAELSNLVLASTNKKKTNGSVKIALQVVDNSGIKWIRYLNGDYNGDESFWNAGYTIVNNSFSVSNNGIYTVCMENSQGERAVSHILVNNINDGILQIPIISSYTNRTTKIKGTAEPNSVVHLITVDGEFEVQVEADGTFEYEIPSQKAGATVSAYVEDNLGRTSATTQVITKRTGPNRPEVEPIKNTITQITGNTRDGIVAQIFVVAGNEVYVSRDGGTEAYKRSEKYNEKKEIIKTDITIQKDGSFIVKLPYGISGNTSVTIYSFDYADRLSKANISRVADLGPNAPYLYTVTDAENKLYGKMHLNQPDSTYEVKISIGEKQYETNVNSEGYFTTTVDKMEAGQKIEVYVTDTVGDKIRSSAVMSYQVQSIDKYIKDTTEQAMFFNEINNKSISITGTSFYEKTNIILNIEDEIYLVKTDSNGNFEYPLNQTLKAGIKVNAIIRNPYSNEIKATSYSVVVGKPYEPQLLNKTIYNTTKYITVLSREKGSVTVEVGEKSYTSKQYTFNAELERYVFEVEIENVDSGSILKVYATNSAGNSTALEVPVELKAPDAPVVEPITTATTVIKGTVKIVDNSNTDTDNTGSNNTADDASSTTTTEETTDVTAETQAVSIVESTGTKVYAKIGKKTYKAVINEDGTFEITIPKQKAGTEITIWGSNSEGKGPISIVTVVKK
jgi:2',3'-cyclic-nucleotide 2'-phosphodiesterase/3'-nucleotidase